MKNSAIQIYQQDLFDLKLVKPDPKQKHKTADSCIFDLADALRAPVLTFSEQWADAIPKRLFDILPIARTKALMLGEHSATYAECVIYIYTRALAAPMDSKWTDIYTHVSCKTLQEYFNEDHWDAVKAPAELTKSLQSKLDGLRRHIYDKRREILKTKLKQPEQPATDTQQAEAIQAPTSPQQSLFQA
jgi:hypothetical protein